MEEGDKGKQTAKEILSPKDKILFTFLVISLSPKNITETGRGSLIDNKEEAGQSKAKKENQVCAVCFHFPTVFA